MSKTKQRNMNGTHLPSPQLNHNRNNHHQQKPIHHSTIPCGACSSSDRWPLHTVRHRGSYRRLCTDCVLKNHQSLFCPLCFQVFDDMPPPLPIDRLICLNCPSIAHCSCVPPDSSAPSFLCPSCSNPNFSYFFSDSDPEAKTKRIKTEDGGNSSLRGHNEKVIDKESTKALLATTRIAAAFLNKVAATTQADAEKCVKDASLAKKKAKEALERQSGMQKTIERYHKYAKGGQTSNTEGEQNLQQLKGESEIMSQKIELIQLSQRKLLGYGLSSCTLDELQEIDSQLERSLRNIRARKAELFMENIEHLKAKERLLKEENERLCHQMSGQEKEVVTHCSQNSQISSEIDVETELFIGLPEMRC